MARRLADRFDYAYLDTGSLYRAVGLGVLRAGTAADDEETAARVSASLDMALLKDPSLREETTGNAASRVAAMPAVRSNLLEFQRKFSQVPPGGAKGAVLDGRDVGTVVCPEADVKLFVTASPDVRARRRFLELESRGEQPDYDKILADVVARDERDMNRADAPLKPAQDALLLDTSELDIDAVFLRAVDLIEERL